MKIAVFTKICLGLGFAAFATIAYATELVVVIKNVKQDIGKIYVAVHQGEQGFTDHVSFKSGKIDAKKPSVTLTFEVEEGDYAIRVYHDVDGNGELNFNRLRMPREPYAFSNNVKPRFGPPGWKKTKFSVGKETVTQELTLLGS